MCAVPEHDGRLVQRAGFGLEVERPGVALLEGVCTRGRNSAWSIGGKADLEVPKARPAGARARDGPSSSRRKAKTPPGHPDGVSR